jgi:hypothetical protein
VAAPATVEPVSEGNLAAAYVISIIAPLVGLFVGIYLMAKKEPGHGVACMVIGIISAGIWSAIVSNL